MNDLLRTKHAAQAVDCDPRTLRALERKGLINPLHDSNGERLFTYLDVAKAREILNKIKTSSKVHREFVNPETKLRRRNHGKKI